MSRIIALGVVGIALALTAQAARSQTPIPPSPADFVIAAAQSDSFEIAAAQLADVQARDPRVKAFAQEMIRDHTRMTKDMRQAAIASKLTPPPPAMSIDQALWLSGLQALRGDEFDKAYVRQQVLAHAQAVAVDGSFADAGTDANLRKAAQAALPTIQQHLKAAEQLRAQVGGG